MTEIKLQDLIIRRMSDVSCPLCSSTGKVMLTDGDNGNLWKHPRPCPICKGVGQIRKTQMPTEEQIANAMMNYSFK